MPVTINGTTGISSDTGYSGDGVSFADGTPSNTLVTTTGGNVGIGTSSPSTFGKLALQVVGTTTPTNATNVGPSSISLYAATNGGSTDSTVGIFGWQSSQPGIGSGIGFSRENGSDWGSQIRFYTHPTTTSNISDLTERARITSGGDLLVGTTSSAFATSTSTGTQITQDGQTLASRSDTTAIFRVTTAATIVQFRYQTSVTGSISTNGSTTAYNTSSDYRLKENVQPMVNALAKVAQLKPCTYTWKGTGLAGEGFIAHELQEVVPDAVTGEKDAVNEDGSIKPQGIDTSFLVATLTAAIQELNAKVDAQAAEIAALKGIKQ